MSAMPADSRHEAVAEEAGAVTDEQRAWARGLALRYSLTSTAILFAAGLMGVLLRDSQANLGRLHDNFWYAMMTAHGLAAFVGWAGFAVMGFAFWVLTQVGVPLRRFGRAMAEATWWLMALGAVGILITTLIFQYAGSWVFLYPISFHSAGHWGRWTNFFFHGSVLLVGLSIVAWSVSICHTVVGPALHAVSERVANRFGVALGLGYLWPKRFATNPKSVPYAVIPLAVIAIDMIIATLPLAVLLVIMMVESLSPGVTVNALVAKNILWWFGHPVVYLLLFPAVAIYYYLIPRYAKRPLVAGNVIAIAWAIAVIANVLVWAHHIYLDYPQGSIQASLNTAMQPVTFALTIPSALSLYSLGMTIYRSEFEWNAASTALFLGLVGWLLAGLSGVVNATIVFDNQVHNTLWIVGHFHHMALLNIGFAVFGATYAFLPELTGKKLYSDKLGKAHIWISFWAGMGAFGIWLIEGLEGAPRRYSVLPARWDTMNQIAVGFVLVLAAAQLLFAANVVQTLRGKVAKERTGREAFAAVTSPAAMMLVTLALIFVGGIVGWVIGHYTGHTKTVKVGAATPAAGGATGAAGAAATAGDATRGKAVFASAGCIGCHTLKAAGAAGTVGPNLDQRRPAYALVVQRVTNGKGAMPSFKGRLSDDQIKDVAAYVSSLAGK